MPGIISRLGYPPCVLETGVGAHEMAALETARDADLVCPACRRPLEGSGGEHRCPGCGAAYSTRAGVPILLAPGSALERGRQAGLHDELSRLHNARKRPIYWNGGFRYVFNFLIAKHARMLAALAPGAGERHLDVGCQDGMILTNLARRYGVRGTGVDVSEASLRLAVARNTAGNRYFLADAQALPFRDGSFDLAHSVGTMEHVPDQNLYLSEMARVLRPGGRLLFDMINRRDDWTVHGIERRWAEFRGRGEAARQAAIAIGHDPATFREAGEVVAMCHSARLRVVRVSHYNALFPLLVDAKAPRLLAAVRGQATDFHGRGLGHAPGDAAGSEPGGEMLAPPPDPGPAGLAWRRAASLAIRGALPLAELLDKPLTSLGYSNTFYIQAVKE